MKKLISYITASYPSTSFSIDLALSLNENGTDILEIGIPFSDPVADGPVIEQANLASIKNGFKFEDIYTITDAVSSKIDTYLMGYFNPFYIKGFEKISSKAKDIKGFIVPDLPFEEALFYKKVMTQDNKHLVSFIAPTTSKSRIKTLVKNAKGFIYLVAYSGITGSGKITDLSQTIESIRENSSTPLYLGFGVNKNNAREKVKNVNGVIVGSAYIKVLLNESLSLTQKIVKASNISKIIKEQINS